ncbi:hypothetical protein cypCar_00007546, partial [Cyprinus carpio]
METESKGKGSHTPRLGKRGCASLSDSSSSSDSDGTSLSDEDDEFDEGHGLPAKTPLTAFLSFKQEAEKRRATNSPAEPNEKLQQQADQYRLQLRRHRVQHRRKMKALRASYRQRLKDKNSVINSLEEVIAQQQSPSSENE